MFKLGDFGQGVVTGLATSVNERLLQDMEDIKGRIKTASDYRVKRAVDEQEERKKEVEDIRKALEEGGSLFKDDPRAAEYAAAMLKEQGNVEAYRALVSQMRDMRGSQDLSSFFERASVDSPVGSYTDYANAYVGQAKTLPTDYKLPEGTIARGDTLVEKLFGDVDYSTKVQERTQDDMAAMGLTTDSATPAFSMPTIGFKHEMFNLAGMEPTKAIEYINNKIVDPNITGPRRAELETMLAKRLQAASKSGDLTTQKTALVMQLGRIKGDSDEDVIAKNQLMSQIADVSFEIKKRELETSGDPTDKDTLALMEARRLAAETGDYTAYAILKKEIDAQGTIPTVAQLLKDDEEELARAVMDGTIQLDSPEYIERMKAITKQRDVILSIAPEVMPSATLVTTIGNQVDDVEESLLTFDSKADEEMYGFAVDTLASGDIQGVGFNALNDNVKKVFNKYKKRKAALRGKAIDQVLGSYDKNSEEYNATLILAAQYKYTPSQDVGLASAEETTTAAAEAEATTTVVVKDSATGTENTVVVSDGVTQQDATNIRIGFPDTDAGAAKFVTAAMADGDTSEGIIGDAKAFGYSEKFISAVTDLSNAKTAPDTVDKEAGIDKEAEVIKKIAEEGNFFYGKIMNHGYIRKLVRDELGMSRDEAIAFIKKNIDKINAEVTPTSTKTVGGGNRRRQDKSSGGLMSQGQ